MTLEDELSDLVRRRRIYAAGREGGTKRQKELGVLEDLLASMAAAGQEQYFAPHCAEQDPPDCWARTRTSHLVAFEVTEFVSQEAIEINERARPSKGQPPAAKDMVLAQWNREGFLRHLGDLLHEKDAKQYLGGPYVEIVALVYAEEYLLIRSEAESWLAQHAFGPFRQLTGAYFLFNYEPNIGYPFRRLALAGA